MGHNGPILPTSSKGYQYILVSTDLFGRRVEFSISVVSNWLRNIGHNSSRWGNVLIWNSSLPRYRDQGANLNNQVILSLYRHLGINHTQGFLFTILRAIDRWKILAAPWNQCFQKWWMRTKRTGNIHLPKALFAYYTAIHDSTRYSPFHVNFVCFPMLPIDVILGRLPSQDREKDTAEYVKEVVSSLNIAYDKVQHNLKKLKAIRGGMMIKSRVEDSASETLCGLMYLPLNKVEVRNFQACSKSRTLWLTRQVMWTTRY